jgi:hypothetical protein
VRITRWAIMQEPGAQARRNREHWMKMGYPAMSPRPRRAGTVFINEGERLALEEFVYNRYAVPGNRQYAGHRFEWRRNGAKNWREDDGNDPAGREWSVLVKLRNGISEHETRFYAWKERR